MKPSRARDAGNTVLSKEFPAGLLLITGANSAVGLRSMPTRYLFLDEVDAYPPSADEEGDPVALAFPLIIYLWKVIVWDKVLGLGTTDPITGMVADWIGTIVNAYVGGRSIEKVTRILRR